MKPKRRSKDYIGQTISGIKIVSYFTVGKKARGYYNLVCHCGKEFTNRAHHILNGDTVSCGCAHGLKHVLPDNAALKNSIRKTYELHAKKRGLCFQLTSTDFDALILSTCYYCGAEPRLSIIRSGGNGRRERKLAYNGIDRIDSSRGYTRDNCVPCCRDCNRAKWELSVEEFGTWLDAIIRHQYNWRKP